MRIAAARLRGSDKPRWTWLSARPKSSSSSRAVWRSNDNQESHDPHHPPDELLRVRMRAAQERAEGRDGDPERDALDGAVGVVHGVSAARRGPAGIVCGASDKARRL